MVLGAHLDCGALERIERSEGAASAVAVRALEAGHSDDKAQRPIARLEQAEHVLEAGVDAPRVKGWVALIGALGRAEVEEAALGAKGVP